MQLTLNTLTMPVGSVAPVPLSLSLFVICVSLSSVCRVASSSMSRLTQTPTSLVATNIRPTDSGFTSRTPIRAQLVPTTCQTVPIIIPSTARLPQFSPHTSPHTQLAPTHTSPHTHLAQITLCNFSFTVSTRQYNKLLDKDPLQVTSILPTKSPLIHNPQSRPLTTRPSQTNHNSLQQIVSQIIHDTPRK